MKRNLKVSFTLLFFIFLLTGCKTESNEDPVLTAKGDSLEIEYAKGFAVTEYDGYKILEVKNPWPDADKTFRYLLVEDQEKVPEELNFDARIEIPVKKIVVTSTTHIPSLEILNEEETLVGFPGLDYISSEETRKLINRGEVTELGKNEAINTEVLIALEPDVVVGFAVNGNNKTFSTIEKSGIPVIFNGDWTEESPLGKAEWIKFFGALYQKTEEAEAFFNHVKNSYKEAKSIAESVEESPTVLSGSMFKDQWYLPYGDSWQAQFLEDANADYVYSETKGSGSISLAFETVLSDARDAEYWIGPGQFRSLQQLQETSPHYEQFRAVKEGNVYTYSNTTGEKEGVLFYELAPVRPDLVLKDLISIFHPNLLPDYERTFYKALD